MAASSDSALLDDVARVRRVLARELETINEYEAFAAASTDPQVRAFFSHLAQEEKEHVAEATHMLRRLDAGQEAHFAQGTPPGHFGESAPVPAAAAPAPASPPERNGSALPLPPQRVLYGQQAPPSSQAAPLTVGSLKRGR